jgi:hypothetical protein
MTSALVCPSGHPLAGNTRERTDRRSCRCLSCERRYARETKARRRARLRIAAAQPDEVCPCVCVDTTGGGGEAGRRKSSEVYVVPPVKLLPPGERAVVLCDVAVTSSGQYGSRFYGFATVAEALEFARIMPCPNSACVGLHLIAWRRDRRIGSAIIDTTRTRPPSLAAELAAAYPRTMTTPPPEFWPTPEELNERLTCSGKVAL